MPKNTRIRRSLVLAASLGAMAVAAPAAQAVEVKVVERVGADELYVTARTNVNDNLSVSFADGVRAAVRSFGTDTIALPPGSGCTHTDFGTFKEVRCEAGPNDRLDRAVVKLGNLADVLNVSAPKGLINMGSGNDTLFGSAILGGGDRLFAMFGGSGNDRITDTGIGGALITGDSGNDVLRGGAGVNRMNGELGSDEIDGGGSDDVIVSAPDNGAADRVTCGDGTGDRVEHDANDTVFVNCEVRTRI